MRGVVAIADSAGGGRSARRRASPPDADPAAPVRIATFNASLNRATQGALQRDLSTPDNAAGARRRGNHPACASRHPAAAGIRLRRRRRVAARPSRLTISGDHSRGRRRSISRTRSSPSRTPACPPGFDLDNDGRIAGGGDALGFGEFPGQYAMVVLSRFPIDTKRVRTFRKFLWRDMPGALLPDDPATPATADWYSTAGARRVATLVEESLGRAGASSASSTAAPARQPSDTAGIRWSRRSQWPAQSRRDPLLARLHHRGCERLHPRRSRQARRPRNATPS